ncbi:hypothetical protein [Nisaea sediminum]|uniref:hypothetical protein n=2 Tax=Pseudomonadota TaxID=1224 RepID=UPI001868608A|nr:hypothetical protein [Nisaea sediminum]
MDEENKCGTPALDAAAKVAEVTKTVSDINPVKAFLGPAAKALGDHFGERVKEWVDRKKNENARYHASAVLGDAGPDDIPDDKQLDLLRWYERAGEVDPNEIEKSAAIKAALKATLAGRGNDADILMSLTKDEILCLGKKNGVQIDSYTTALLKETGLSP